MKRENFFVKKRQKRGIMTQNILKIIFLGRINYVYTYKKKDASSDTSFLKK